MHSSMGMLAVVTIGRAYVFYISLYITYRTLRKKYICAIIPSLTVQMPQMQLLSAFAAFFKTKKRSYILLLFLCASNNLFHVNIGCDLIIRAESKGFM